MIAHDKLCLCLDRDGQHQSDVVLWRLANTAKVESKPTVRRWHARH